MSDTANGIVLIEDNPDDAELALRALRRSHLTNPVTVLEDGAQAIAYFFSSTSDGPAAPPGRDPMPRLVLLDLKLPKVDGLEVLRRLKADRDLQRIPVVVLTSSGEARDLAQAYAFGANSYVVKPVEFDQFREALHEVGQYWLRLNQAPP